jgi:hypothetical protein
MYRRTLITSSLLSLLTSVRQNKISGKKCYRLYRCTLLFVAVMVCVLTIALIFTTGARTPLTDRSTRQVHVSASNPSSDRLEAELVSFTTTGFNPSEIKRPEGQVLLIIENRSGAIDLKFQLRQPSGDKLREIVMTKGKISSRLLIDFNPGEYELTEINHPEQVCKIIITDK